MNLAIKARRQDWADGISIVICERLANGRLAVARELTLTEIPEGGFIQPALCIDNTAAQSLMDELWNCGLRPTEGTGSAGALAATQQHLADMQKLVTFYTEGKRRGTN